MDATKLHANASRHSALSYGHAEKIEAQLQGEVAVLLARAEAVDAEPLPEGLNHAIRLTPLGSASRELGIVRSSK